MPRFPDLAIFVVTDRQNRLLYPLLHMRARGKCGKLLEAAMMKLEKERSNETSMILIRDKVKVDVPAVKGGWGQLGTP
jgi:hypothetical protein